MKPTRLILENFGPFEKLDYTFKDSVVALVGQNKTDDGQGSNGTGKSNLSQAIYYALTGNNMRGVLDKKLIRKGESSAKIHLNLYCDKRNKTLSIEREIPMKGTGKLRLKENDEDVSFATVKDGNDWILNWLQISSEDLKSYFIICKEYYKSFFKSSNTDKLALISRFINVSSLDNAKFIIGLKINDLNGEKQVVEGEKFKLEGRLETLEEKLLEEENKNVEEEKERIISQLQSQIQSQHSKIDVIDQENKALQDEIKNKKLTIEVLKKDLEKNQEMLSGFDLSELEEGIEDIKKELKEIRIEQDGKLKEQDKIQALRDEIKSKIRKVRVNLSGAIECPKCHHKFLTLRGTSLEEEKKKEEEYSNEDKKAIKKELKIEKELKDYEDILSELFQMKSSLEEQFEEVNKNVRFYQNKVDSLQSELSQTERKINKNKSLIEENKKDKERALQKIESLEGEIEETKKRTITINTEPIEKEIEEVGQLYNQKEKRVKELDNQIFKKNEWINRFKDFKMYIASKQIKHIQNEANEVLQRENSDLRVLIEPFKKNFKGDIKDEITAYVVRDEAESFWYYSGGERARVEIALIIAIQQMINSTNPYGGLEFLSIDEITEGLSEESLYDVIEALSFIKYPILIATHIFNQNAKCEILKIVKEDGISRIVE